MENGRNGSGHDGMLILYAAKQMEIESLSFGFNDGSDYVKSRPCSKIANGPEPMQNAGGVHWIADDARHPHITRDNGL
jgi:hypothetical protein